MSSHLLAHRFRTSDTPTPKGQPPSALLAFCPTQHREEVLQEKLELEQGWESNQSPCLFSSSNFNEESTFPGRFHDSDFVCQLPRIQVSTHMKCSCGDHLSYPFSWLPAGTPPWSNRDLHMEVAQWAWKAVPSALGPRRSRMQSSGH